MKKPKKPIQEWDELVDDRVSFYNGASVQEILDQIGEDIDLNEAKFYVDRGYYDELEYYIEFKRLVHRKMTDKTFAKKMAKYESDLAKYKSLNPNE